MKNWEEEIKNAKHTKNGSSGVKEHWIRTFFENLTLPFHRLKMRIRDVYYEVKYGFQRMFRGYGDNETFDIDCWFMHKYTKILKKFRTLQNSYPSQFKSYDEWAKALDEMISYFELSDDYSEWYCQDDFEYKYEDHRYNEQLAYYYKRKALDMFVLYFDDLWD